LVLRVVCTLNPFLESVLRSELYWASDRLLKLLKLLLQVLAYAWLTRVANGPSLSDSTQKDLTNETLMKINGVISAELSAVEAGPRVYEADSQWILDNSDG